MRPRASGLLAVLLAAGCTAGQPYPPSGGGAMLPADAAPGPAGQRVAILLPLSGSNAALGQAMLRAARLALASPGSPALDARDTHGTPDGAVEAARQSLAAGDTLILGPLTNSETAAVAPVAQAAGVAVLAFTSDQAQARPGVWVMGITAEQQVGRLVAAARADGRSRFAAVLPEGAFGQALGDALVRDTQDGGTPAQVRRASGFAGTNAALKQVSGYAERRGAAQAQLKAARASGDADARRDAAAAVAAPAAPPPVDALLLGTGSATLRDLGSVLAFYDLVPPAVRLLGPALWAHDAPQLGALAGAWYVAPDPALRARFVAQYVAAAKEAPAAAEAGVAAAPGAPGTGAPAAGASAAGASGAAAGAAGGGAAPAVVPAGPPPALADIAYDAAAVARVLAAQGYGPVALQRAEGFAGTDGVFALLPGGAVRRDLAVFQIDAGGGSHVVSAAGAPPGA